jgi:hypothetical protein
VTEDSKQTVVIDTNAIAYGAWWLESPGWRVLFHLAETGEVRLLVPDLVVREAAGRFRSEVAQRSEAAAAAARKLGDLIGDATDATSEFNSDEAAVSYEAELRTRLANGAAVVGDIPMLDLAELTQHAIDRRKPFDPKGNGFRDALLWRIVLGAARDCDRLALVSKDATAFLAAPDSQDPHPDLVADLGDIGFQGEFQICSSVNSYLHSTGVTDPIHTARALVVVEQENPALRGAVEGRLRGEFLPVHWAGVTTRVLDAQALRVSLAGTVGGDDELLLASLDVSASLRLSVRFENLTTPRAEEVTVNVALAATATFDITTEQLGEPEFSLPNPGDIPDVVSAVYRVNPSSVIPSDLPAEMWVRRREAMEAARTSDLMEVYREAMEMMGPPDLVERYRELLEVLQPPNLVERYQEMAEVLQPPNLVEVYREMVELMGPPDLVERYRKLVEVLQPPNPWEQHREIWQRMTRPPADFATVDEDEVPADQGPADRPMDDDAATGTKPRHDRLDTGTEPTGKEEPDD